MNRNAELEAQIQKNPDDASLYQVYADWLGERGDPRGELIALSLASETSKDPAIMQKLAELHAANDAAWIGAPREHVSFGWRRGFVDSITLGNDENAEIDMAAAYRWVRANTKDSPACALLRAITLAAFEDEDDYRPNYTHVVTAMAETGVAPSLRMLRFDRGGYWDISSTEVGDISPLYPHLPNLESLYIELGSMELGTIDLPALKSFEVYTGGFTGDNCRSVIDATWPNLESLILRFGSSQDYGGTSTADDIRPLFSSTKLGKVRHLALANAPWINEVMGELANSKLLAQLATLDISWGFLDDNGVKIMLEHADKFRHLEKISVHDSYIQRGMELVTALPQTRGTEDQKVVDNDDDWRYCHIGE